MDILIIALIALAVLSMAGFGYGRYYAAPIGAAPAPWVNPLGALALLFIVGVLVLWLMGWSFGVDVSPPR